MEHVQNNQRELYEKKRKEEKREKAGNEDKEKAIKSKIRREGVGERVEEEES